VGEVRQPKGDQPQFFWRYLLAELCETDQVGESSRDFSRSRQGAGGALNVDRLSG
jgi:hypothetical protein